MLFSLNRMVAQVKINKKTLTKENSQENCLAFLIRLERILLLEVGKKKNSLTFQKLEIPETGEFSGISGKKQNWRICNYWEI